MINIISKSTVMPLSITELRANSWVDGTQNDTELNDLASEVTAYIEKITGLDFTATVYDEFFNCFNNVSMTLKKTGTVSSVKYFDVNNVEITLNAANYRVFQTHFYTMIFPTTVFPTTHSRIDAVRITYTVNHSTNFKYFQIYKRCAKLMINHWFDNRSTEYVGTITSEAKFGSTKLLNSLMSGVYR